MRIGVLGTGTVGRTLGCRLAELSHEVMMGARHPDNPSAAEWLASVGTGQGASTGTFADAAAHGELVVNATAGVASLTALALAGEPNLNGKVLVDVANPLDFAQGFPPTLAVSGTDSLGERIQRAFPRVLVVKTLNTVSAEVMVHPERLTDEHTVFLAGEDPEAKATVTDLLRDLGWRSILDLGGIYAARGMEMYLPLWLTLAGRLATVNFNLRLVRV